MSIRKFHLVSCLLMACLACSLAAGQAQSPEVEMLTLEQAIALALRDNRQIKNSMLETFKFDDRVAATRARRLPEFKFNALGSQLLSSLDFKFERGVFGAYPNGEPNPATDSVISTPRRPTFVLAGQINQPLSQLYSVGLELKRLGVGREIAERRTEAQRQEVINSVKRTYYAILQTQIGLRTMEETIRLYRELDRITGEYVIQKVALKADELEVKTRLAKSEYEAATLAGQLASQKERLNQLLGRDISAEFNVSAAPEFSGYEIDIAAARERALASRPETQEARLRIKQAEYDRRIKKAEYIPEVSLSFSYISPHSINFIPRQISSVGVAVSWEPFDWGRKKRELAEKSRNVEQAQISLREVESQALIEVNAKFRRLQQTWQAMAIGRMVEETARERLRVASNRYAAKAALLKDALGAQASLAEANQQYQQALLAFWAARADFEEAIGGVVHDASDALK